MSQNRKLPVRKQNFPDTWPDDDVICMYTQLKAAVDESKKSKKEGRIKRVVMRREHENIARQIFERKRHITFRSDTGSCEVSPDSQFDLEPEWVIKSWFDASQIALKLLQSDYKKATANKQEGQPRPVNQPLVPQDNNRGPPGNSSTAKPGAPGKRAAPTSSPDDAPAPQRQARLVAVAPAHLQQPAFAVGQQLPPRNTCRDIHRSTEPLFDPAAAPGDRVAINQLTSTGVSRLVEIALRTAQPQAVHIQAHYRAAQRFVAEGLTGEDLSQCTACDLIGILNGPPSRRQVVVDAVSEFYQFGGIPRILLQSWGIVDPASPLPTSGPQQHPVTVLPVVVKPEPQPNSSALQANLLPPRN
mmetsp:Transcript_32796/g.93065  ORF Transcript_32796/g.93065 Transcript_32796/m.93065 type:complete len:358 (+) Transcript_32796:308-1381(+)|eukprot:CAMPEP_0117660410 /NCGR_PEP_ID=MMETSP0804-20121206/6952_1 /TAXON_ID=1074897 /ORGANISM="Tetraselmis astigmatica, Strain CCMP880" /LENGTH=357 /DNA_ID=CAMNT_0005467135 /DNA_START=221 /DNA_END=1294 /DNA_ORIENTATION=-